MVSNLLGFESVFCRVFIMHHMQYVRYGNCVYLLSATAKNLAVGTV